MHTCILLWKPLRNFCNYKALMWSVSFFASASFYWFSFPLLPPGQVFLGEEFSVFSFYLLPQLLLPIHTHCSEWSSIMLVILLLPRLILLILGPWMGASPKFLPLVPLASRNWLLRYFSLIKSTKWFLFLLWGSKLMMVRSRPKPRSGVRCSDDWATQVPISVGVLRWNSKLLWILDFRKLNLVLLIRMLCLLHHHHAALLVPVALPEFGKVS